VDARAEHEEPRDNGEDGDASTAQSAVGEGRADRRERQQEKGTRSYLRKRKPVLRYPKKRACAKKWVAKERPLLLSVQMPMLIIRAACGSSFGLRRSKRLIEVSLKPPELQAAQGGRGGFAGDCRLSATVLVPYRCEIIIL
jgi:hypothetical protein